MYTIDPFASLMEVYHGLSNSNPFWRFLFCHDAQRLTVPSSPHGQLRNSSTYGIAKFLNAQHAAVLAIREAKNGGLT